EDVKERVEQAGDSATKDIEKAKDNAESQIGDYVDEVESAKDSTIEDIDKALPEVEDKLEDIRGKVSEVDFSDTNLIIPQLLTTYRSYLEQFKIEKNGRKLTTIYSDERENATGLIAFRQVNSPIEVGNVYTLSGRMEINGEPINQDTFPDKLNTKNSNNEINKFSVDDEGNFSFVHLFDNDNWWILHSHVNDINLGDEIVIYDLTLNKASYAFDWKPNPSDIVTTEQYEKLKNAIIALGGSV
ncbi:hypothetical protein WN867_11595, partial [Tetragenococcus halophilus]